jgi:hypothetical protein
MKRSLVSLAVLAVIARTIQQQRPRRVVFTFGSAIGKTERLPDQAHFAHRLPADPPIGSPDAMSREGNSTPDSSLVAGVFHCLTNGLTGNE